MKKLLLIIIMVVAFSATTFAQKEARQWLRKGNQYFQKEDYNKAELQYRKVLDKDPKQAEANYNLANTLYKTERGEEAAKTYQDLLKEIKLLPKERAADVAHNAGNLSMAAQDYASAVDMYKESLRHRPTDEETRYNLALAQKLLEQQQQEGGGNDDKEENQGDNQQQEQQQDQQQQEQQHNQQQDQQNKPQEQQPADSQQMSQDNAEKILEAYLQDEKDTQRKVEQMKQQQQKGKRSRPKNW